MRLSSSRLAAVWSGWQRRGRWPRRGRAWFPVLLATCAGCAVGPNYVRPTVPAETRYKEQPPAQAAGEWQEARPQDNAPRGSWWTVFGDPELDALEGQVAAANQTVAQAEAAFRGARALARGARAPLYPTVSVGASATRSSGVSARSAATAGAVAPTVTTYSLPVDVSWELDLFGGIRRGAEAAAANAQASAANLAAVRLAMHAELAADYFALRGLDAQQQLLDATVAAYRTALQLTTNRFKQGIATGIDVAQAQAQLETVQAQATDLGIARAETEHAIAVLVGQPPAQLTIAPRPLAGSPPEIPVGLPSELLQRRPDVAAAERQVAAANAEIGVARAAYFPALTLGGSAGYQSSTLTRFFSLPNRFWSVGPALAETLFAGGRRRAASEQAVAAYDATVAAYRASALVAFQEVEDSLAALRLLTVEAGQQQRAVAAAEQSLRMAQDQYRAGVATYLQVVSAQTAALASERAAVSLTTARYTATVNLIKALGGGWRPEPAAPAR